MSPNRAPLSFCSRLFKDGFAMLAAENVGGGGGAAGGGGGGGGGIFACVVVSVTCTCMDNNTLKL